MWNISSYFDVYVGSYQRDSFLRFRGKGRNSCLEDFRFYFLHFIRQNFLAKPLIRILALLSLFIRQDFLVKPLIRILALLSSFIRQDFLMKPLIRILALLSSFY